ncbi:hypothetical protein Tco_1018771 [Tanacetum coccineum]|uniref:Uncharacterized protein n=1 Tax=Tanacetum coccineum TaxID=301880 RepID=A0ABQ5FV84_9ASTR
MVACLEKSEGNADFHEIVDFLTASTIHYALTQIHATVDGKTVVISESSMRSDLHFNDEDDITCLTNDVIFENLALMGNLDTHTKKFLMYPRFLQLFLNNQITLAEHFSDVYLTPAHTKKVFTNIKRKGKDFSGRVTPLFASMFAPPVVEGEGSGQPFEPQPAPSTAQPRIEEQIPVTESSSPQNTQSPRQALQEDTQLPQTSVPIPNVADEDVFKDTVSPSTSTAGDIFEDEIMTIADTLMAIRSTRPRTASVVIHNVEEEPRKSTPAPTAQPSSKDKGKAIMVESAKEKAAEQEAKDAALIEKMEDIQARMDAD